MSFQIIIRKNLTISSILSYLNIIIDINKFVIFLLLTLFEVANVLFQLFFYKKTKIGINCFSINDFFPKDDFFF